MVHKLQTVKINYYFTQTRCEITFYTQKVYILYIFNKGRWSIIEIKFKYKLIHIRPTGFKLIKLTQVFTELIPIIFKKKVKRVTRTF